MPYKYIKDVDVKGKTIVVRAGLDTDVQNRRIVVSARIREHAKSLKQLADKGAKQVVLAHQGKKGQDDFISLGQHAAVLAKETGIEIALVGWEENYVEVIKGMKPGDILLMENTRFNDDEAVEKSAEEHSKSTWVKSIASVSELYVQNALSVCHRKHASVLGFSPLLPCYVGPLLLQQLHSLQRFERNEKPCYFILGGAKVEDSIKLVASLLDNKNADAVLLCGLLGEIFLLANGTQLGAKERFLKDKGLLNLTADARAILEKHSGKILLPADVAVEKEGQRTEIAVEQLPSNDMIYDIGEKTIAMFKKKIAGAKLLVHNGTAGVYEKPGFENGTKLLFKAISESRVFSLLAGGDTETAVERLGFSRRDFGHVSLAGKATMNYLAGRELPGLKVLQ